MTVYSFHTEDSLTNFRPTKPKKLKSTPSTSTVNKLLHEQSLILPISCLDASLDGQLAASGCAQGLVRIWQLNTHQLQSTLKGHSAQVTCVKFSPNNLLVISGSEDKVLMVWTVADSTLTLTYKVAHILVNGCEPILLKITISITYLLVKFYIRLLKLYCISLYR